MPYCPQCLTEYVEGATECMDCKVPLRAGPPPPPAPSPEEEPNVRFVPVRIFQGLHAQFQADLARNVLEAEGIESSVTGDLGAGMLPGADVVQLLVREEDEARASEVLQEFLETPVGRSEAASEEESAESADEEKGNR